MKRFSIGTGMKSIVVAWTGGDGRLLGGRLIARILCLLLALASLVTVRAVFAQSASLGARVRLEAGMEKEDVDGDLEAAMEIYQKITADSSAPRDVRAKALLRLAGCDEKLGKQAKQIYQQILHDYADQPAAAQARKRLALIKEKEQIPPPRTMSMRKIDSLQRGRMGPTDTDGERAMYSSGGTLYFGDVGGHTRHMIGVFGRHGAAPSKDFSMVALNLKADSTRPHTLAVVKIDGTGYRELIRDDAKSSMFGITSSFNLTWSWDNKYVEICDFNPLSNLLGQVWVVSVADGQRRVLVDQADGFVRKAVFSPDGQFMAYEVWPRNDLDDHTSRVFVIPIHGGEPRLVFESARWKPGDEFMSLMDWTADGRYLAVHDVRQSKSALYLQPIKEGAADGEASFLRYGEFDDGYTTAAGALVVQDNTVRPDNVVASIASMESDGKIASWRSLDLNAKNDPSPSFSPDGNRIAYVGTAPDRTRRSLVVRELASGQDREIYQSSYGSLVCQYSIHNPRVFCTVEKEKGETELFSVEVESGAVEHIANFPETRYLVRSGWDDQSFYLSPNGFRWRWIDPPIVKWNRSTELETVLARDKDFYQMPTLDSRSVVGLRDGTLMVRASSGGEWVPLVSGIGMNLPVFPTPDGKWVIYQDRVAQRKMSLFRVPIAGGQPQRIGTPSDDQFYWDVSFSPDSRQILVWKEKSIDLWLLENFEPLDKK
jgi:Tol biopolymer transport system component